jgi:predicted aspartyl protease
MRRTRPSISHSSRTLLRLSAGALITIGIAACQQRPAQETAQSVAFDADFGLVFVPVTVAGSDSLWFLLDTGFEYSVLNADHIGRLGLVLTDTQTVPQPGGTVTVGTVPATTLSLAGRSVADVALRALPLTQLQPVIGRALDGIIGHDIIARLTIEIDYGRHRLVLHEPARFRYAGDGAIVPVTIVNDEPFVDGEILQPHRPPIRGRFKLDTGSLDALGLNRNFLHDADVLAPDQPTVRLPGVAVGGETEGIVFTIDGFRLGGYTLRDLTVGATLESAGFEDRDDAGTLGAEILGRFTVILDYRRERIILEPSERLTLPGTWDRSGLWLVATDPDFATFRVRSVFPDSPADAAGMEVGDEIVAVNGRPAPEWRLAEVWQVLRGEEGTTVRLRVQRGDTMRTISLTLRRLL